MKKGTQAEYNLLLDNFHAEDKTYMENVRYLCNLGYTYEQAKNAVYVYIQGGIRRPRKRLTWQERDRLLDEINAEQRMKENKLTHSEATRYLMECVPCTYRQANSAVYRYRKERGLFKPIYKNLL